jgi:hypothetical protein
VRIGGGGTTEVSLSLDSPLPLVHEVHHEAVNDRHLWVGIQEAALVVAGEAQHGLISRLVAGESPRCVATDTGWPEVSSVISLLATSGLIRGLTGYRDRQVSEIGRFARLHLTRSCQRQCVHCYADSSPHVDRSNELPTSRWLRFVADFADQGGERVLFTGGEALLHKGCIELMGAARERGPGCRRDSGRSRPTGGVDRRPH